MRLANDGTALNKAMAMYVHLAVICRCQDSLQWSMAGG